MSSFVSPILRPFASVMTTRRAHHVPAIWAKSENVVVPVILPLVDALHFQEHMPSRVDREPQLVVGVLWLEHQYGLIGGIGLCDPRFVVAICLIERRERKIAERERRRAQIAIDSTFASRPSSSASENTPRSFESQ